MNFNSQKPPRNWKKELQHALQLPEKNQGSRESGMSSVTWQRERHTHGQEGAAELRLQAVAVGLRNRVQADVT